MRILRFRLRFLMFLIALVALGIAGYREVLRYSERGRHYSYEAAKHAQAVTSNTCLLAIIVDQTKTARSGLAGSKERLKNAMKRKRVEPQPEKPQYDDKEVALAIAGLSITPRAFWYPNASEFNTKNSSPTTPHSPTSILVQPDFPSGPFPRIR